MLQYHHLFWRHSLNTLERRSIFLTSILSTQFLFDVNQKNRLSQLGLLKRFSLTCYGTQPTLETMRTEKTEMFRLLKNKRNDPEYEKWFLKYVPSDRSLEKKGQVMAVEPPKKTKRRKRKKAKTLKEKRKSEYLY